MTDLLAPHDERDATSAPSRVDLHTHSHFSDGVLAPAALVQEAGRRGLRVLGLTDHDTTAGLAEAEAEAARVGIDLVPGVELSTSDGAREVHILGYLYDRTDARLQAALREFERLRWSRIEQIVARLAITETPIELQRVRELAGQGTAGRPHVARALVERGYADSIADAFDRFIGYGRPAYVPRPKIDPVEAIALVREAGGVAVLAHPGTAGDIEVTLARLVPAGLGGMEVYYGEYDDETRQRLRVIADRWGLIPTGGSDFHGTGFKAARELGGPHVPISSVERLRGAASRSRAAAPRPTAVAVSSGDVERRPAGTIEPF